MIQAVKTVQNYTTTTATDLKHTLEILALLSFPRLEKLLPGIFPAIKREFQTYWTTITPLSHTSINFLICGKFRQRGYMLLFRYHGLCGPVYFWGWFCIFALFNSTMWLACLLYLFALIFAHDHTTVFLSNLTSVTLHMLTCSLAHTLSRLFMCGSFANIGNANIMCSSASSNCWHNLHVPPVSTTTTCCQVIVQYLCICVLLHSSVAVAAGLAQLRLNWVKLRYQYSQEQVIYINNFCVNDCNNCNAVLYTIS